MGCGTSNNNQVHPPVVIEGNKQEQQSKIKKKTSNSTQSVNNSMQEHPQNTVHTTKNENSKSKSTDVRSSAPEIKNLQNQHDQLNNTVDEDQNEIHQIQSAEAVYSKEKEEIQGEIVPKQAKLRYKIGDLIDKGAYGKVYQSLDLDTGKFLAVQEVQINGNDVEKVKKELDALRKQISLLKQLNHKNIVRYIHTEILEQENCVHIILQYVPGGSLRSLLNKFGAFSQRIAAVYTSQILEGLSYLHSQDVIHRDIQCANILTDADGKIQLTDFGTSTRILATAGSTNESKDNVMMSKSFKGSPYWMAPEVVNRTGHTVAADIWSVGCVVIQMLTGQPPYSNTTTQIMQVLVRIAKGQKPSYPKNISKNCKLFLDATLKTNHTERQPASVLLQHPFITNVYQEESGVTTPRSVANFNGLPNWQTHNTEESFMGPPMFQRQATRQQTDLKEFQNSDQNPGIYHLNDSQPIVSNFIDQNIQQNSVSYPVNVLTDQNIFQNGLISNNNNNNKNLNGPSSNTNYVTIEQTVALNKLKNSNPSNHNNVNNQNNQNPNNISVNNSNTNADINQNNLFRNPPNHIMDQYLQQPQDNSSVIEENQDLSFQRGSDQQNSQKLGGDTKETLKQQNSLQNPNEQIINSAYAKEQRQILLKQQAQAEEMRLQRIKQFQEEQKQYQIEQQVQGNMPQN